MIGCSTSSSPRQLTESVSIERYSEYVNRYFDWHNDAPTVGELIDPTELEIIEKLLRQKSYVTNETVHRDVVEPVQYILEFQEIAVACYNNEKPSYGLVSILYIDDIFSERSKYITAYKGGVMTPTELKPGRNQQRYVDVPNHYLR